MASPSSHLPPTVKMFHSLCSVAGSIITPGALSRTFFRRFPPGETLERSLLYLPSLRTESRWDKAPGAQGKPYSECGACSGTRSRIFQGFFRDDTRSGEVHLRRTVGSIRERKPIPDASSDADDVRSSVDDARQTVTKTVLSRGLTGSFTSRAADTRRRSRTYASLRRCRSFRSCISSLSQHSCLPRSLRGLRTDEPEASAGRV